MFHLCPASKAAVRQEKYPAHVRGRNGVTGRFFLQAGGLHYMGGTGLLLLRARGSYYGTGQQGRFFLQAGGLHYNNGAGRVKNAVKLFWNVVDVGFLNYLCLEIIK